MASPTQNHVGSTAVDPASTGVGKYLIYGRKWSDGLKLTYSFPTGTATYDSNYSIYNEWGDWLSLSRDERTAVRDALNTWSSFANLGFVEVADNSTTVGELRFTHTKYIASWAAHAYYPDNYVAAGDVWFSWFNFNDDGGGVSRGSYDFYTILHEVGHALGLKHPFEGQNIIPSDKDSFFYTIMSYTASPWSTSGDNWASFYPTTPMYYDLVAIQALYGKARVNTGNNTYTFKDGSYYWQAINDSGGVDTIVYSGSENTRINLNPSAFSSLSEAITFGNGRSSRDTVTIGPGVMIENATGGSGHDTLSGNGVANVLNGGAGNDALHGGAGNDTLYGGVGNDALYGSVGSDRLNGAAGADRMYGGAGNDIYSVDNLGDMINESISGSSGVDSVQSAISFSLANAARVLGSVENLTLIGTASISGVGNKLNNVLVGNSAANLLEGGAGYDRLIGRAGADRMRAGAGSDIYHVDNAGDIVDEGIAGSNGDDIVQSVVTFSLANAARVLGSVENLTLLGTAAINGTGNSLSNRIYGNAGANVLSGGAGNDVLIGGAGADRMGGGAGSDIYHVDNAGDIVDERVLGSNGDDIVQSVVTFSLANATRVLGSVENLTLLGTAAINGTGNSLSNRIYGNAGANVLSGGAGNDTLIAGAGSDVLDGGTGADRMRGEAGNDIYRVDNTADIVDESGSASNGVDTVQSLVSFGLANAVRVLGSVENLTLLGTAAISGTGNGLANVMTGNGAANTLSGGAGNDLLIGGAGHDNFLFNSALGSANVDTISDFVAADDSLHLASAIFTGLASLGSLAETAFVKNTSGLAQDSDDRVIYQTSTGNLFYDSDGLDGATAIGFARLSPSLDITYGNFQVI